jgi:hypothetical protein
LNGGIFKFSYQYGTSLNISRFNLAARKIAILTVGILKVTNMALVLNLPILFKMVDSAGFKILNK